MKKSIQDLLALQEIDLRIRELEARYRSIPDERAAIVAEFEVVKKAYLAAMAETKQVEKTVRQCQTDIAVEQENLKNSKIKSTSVKKAAEYEAINAQIAGCEKRISDLETNLIELYDQLEAAQEKEKKAERSYKSTGRLAQRDVRELDALKEKILAEIKAKSAESREKEKNVSQAVLPRYKQLLASGKGKPLSAIDKDLCGNCCLTLPPSSLMTAAKGELIECDHCSYFLYDPDPKA